MVLAFRLSSELCMFSLNPQLQQLHHYHLSSSGVVYYLTSIHPTHLQILLHFAAAIVTYIPSVMHIHAFKYVDIVNVCSVI